MTKEKNYIASLAAIIAVLNMVLARLPNAVTAETMTKKIKEMINPYSMAVAPD